MQSAPQRTSKTSPYKRMDASSRPSRFALSSSFEPLRSRLYPLDREKVLRKRTFHRQNPLELETPNLEESLAKHPSDLGLDSRAQDDFLLSDFSLAGR